MEESLENFRETENSKVHLEFDENMAKKPAQKDIGEALAAQDSAKKNLKRECLKNN